MFPSFGLGIIQLSKKAIMAPVMVRVSSPNFPVLDCISYSTQEVFVALAMVRVSSQYFPFGLYTIQLRKNDVLALARVRVSSQYNFQFWIVYHTVAQERYRGSRYG